MGTVAVQCTWMPAKLGYRLAALQMACTDAHSGVQDILQPCTKVVQQ